MVSFQSAPTDYNALLETNRGEIRKFRKLDALVSLVKALGVDKFSVRLSHANKKTP
jgi:hypothetical protein